MRTIHILDFGISHSVFHPDDTILTMEWEFVTVEQKISVTWFGSEEFGKHFSLN